MRSLPDPVFPSSVTVEALLRYSIHNQVLETLHGQRLLASTEHDLAYPAG